MASSRQSSGGVGTRLGDHAELASPRACCNPIYAALDALEAAVASLDAKAGDVERIDVATFRFASAMRNPDPPNYFASNTRCRTSPPAWWCGQRRFRGGRRLRARRSALWRCAPRPHCRGSLMNPSVPAAKPARVTVTLKTAGRPRGPATARGRLPQSIRALGDRQKFRELAGLALTPQGIEEVESAIDGLER